MTGGFPHAAFILLATCGTAAGSSRVFGILVPPLIFAAWVWISWLILWRDTDDSQRLWLLGLMVVTAVTGWVIFRTADGDTSQGSHFESFQLSLLAAAAIGFVTALLSRQFSIWRGMAAAIAGDVLIPGGLVLLLVWALSLSGSCLD